MIQNQQTSPLIDLVILLGERKTEINQLAVEVCDFDVRLVRPKCQIVLPIKNITSTGKNKKSLLIFVTDPLRDQAEEEFQEDMSGPVENKMDQILFGMLQKINQGAEFINIIRGNFTLELVFGDQAQLCLIRSAIEEGMAREQQNVGVNEIGYGQDMDQEIQEEVLE